jgi:hypothetical protein
MASRTGDTPPVRDGNGSETLAALLIGWAVNVVALLIGAALLGIVNPIVKLVLALPTLPLILLTLGLAYFVLGSLFGGRETRRVAV